MHAILKKQWVQKLLSWIVALYLRFVYGTSRWKVLGAEHIQPFFQSGRPVIVVFWHQDMAMAPFAWCKKLPFNMLISDHGDGRLIARIVNHLGIDCVHGSSSHHKGVATIHKVVRSLESGVSVGITPDGPRGPRGVLKEGVYAIARLSQCPVLTLHWCSSSVRILSKAWDHMKIPLPFGTFECVWSPPMCCAGGKADEKACFMQSVSDALPDIR